MVRSNGFVSAGVTLAAELIHQGPFRAGDPIRIPLTANKFNELRDELIAARALEVRFRALAKGARFEASALDGPAKVAKLARAEALQEAAEEVATLYAGQRWESSNTAPIDG